MIARRQQYPVKIAILAYDDCLTSAVTGITDAFRIATACARDLKVQAHAFDTIILGDGGSVVRGSSGFAIAVAGKMDAPGVDIAIVPPIAGPIHEIVRANPNLVRRLSQSRDRIVASVCTGAFFLAEAKLLTGLRATTNPIYANAFRAEYSDVILVPEERLTDEGHVLCAGSTTAFLDLAIHLIDRFVGHEVAVLTAKTLCMDKNHRSQLPYFLYVAPKDHGDEVVLDLQTWLEKEYVKPVTVSQIARRGAMSERTLSRRFVSATGMGPVDYLHRLRVENAKRLLEISNLSIDQITSRVGYEDARSFSRLFRARVGASPGEYRLRFGARKMRVPQSK